MILLRTNGLARALALGCTVTALSIAPALAGPCNTPAKQRDAGAGPTVGNTGQAPRADSSSTDQHPPTSTVGRAAGGGPASSEDAQRQMQGQPTAAQQGQGMKSADKDC